MRKTLFVLLGAVLATVLSAPLVLAVDFIPPQVGSSSVTINDAAIPVLPGTTDPATKTQVIRIDGADPTGSAKVVQLDRTLVAVGHSRLVSEQVQTEWAVHMGSQASFDVALRNPTALDSFVFVVDLWDGSSTYMEPEAAATFDVDGFEAGATSFEVNGLEEGARLFVLHMSPGRSPIGTWVTEGSWQDLDGEADGVLDTAVLRNIGPPHVLPGDLMVLALEGATSGAAMWEASGDTVRYTVPVASHVIGSTGTPFISDLSISNPFGLITTFWMRFVQENRAWSQAPEEAFLLFPGQTLSWTDVLQSGFGIADNVKGTLQIGGFAAWTLKVTSRNYAVSDEGEQFGIAIPGFATFEPMTAENLWIIPGLKENADFRSNLIVGGAVPQASRITCRLIVASTVVATKSWNVPGYGLLQVNQVAQKMGAGNVNVNDGYLEMTVDSGAVFAGLSVVDGSADDAAYIVAEKLVQ